ncbi:helix-turn-helix domain-containing protein [Actinomadura sediminis]|uniref:Multiprotein-bridging factor 1 family protein n=1 Tax=Actinomadura sediminis TaxID=1038904 RepID=A0ABW3EPQ5_9ACTN
MNDRSIDPTDPDLTIGDRIRYHRERRGMSRQALGELIGRNGRWVKAVERGEIQDVKLPRLLDLAEVLRLQDVADLAGTRPVPMSMFRGPGHPALVRVRDAINSVAIGRTDSPPSLDYLELRLRAAWQARHAAPDHRTVLGRRLPDLIQDAKAAVRGHQGADRRRALALLAGTYNLTQFYVAYQPSADLLWRVVERSLMAAEESEDPRAIGGAVWLAAQAHRDAGDLDAAEAVNREGLELIAPHVEGADDDLLAMWGALHHEVAYTAARAKQPGVAWGWWDRADEIAQRLPADHYDLMTSFSRAIMPAHAVTVAVELRHGGEARRQARRAAKSPIPSQPRRGRHEIEVARAYRLAGDQEQALAMLKRAQGTAPETIRYNGHARRMLAELVTEGPAGMRPAARDLADRVGVLVR